jgi:hypothetical protein
MEKFEELELPAPNGISFGWMTTGFGLAELGLSNIYCYYLDSKNNKITSFCIYLIIKDFCGTMFYQTFNF